MFKKSLITLSFAMLAIAASSAPGDALARVKQKAEKTTSATKTSKISKNSLRKRIKSQFTAQAKNGKKTSKKFYAAEETSSPSVGKSMGLHGTSDQLRLQTSAAIIMDAGTRAIVYAKNAQTALPMASITKLMTALIVIESGTPKDEILTIAQDDVDTEKNSRSRLPVGTRLTRGEMLHLALMSSENRAAHALARSQPGGLETFVSSMNAKAKLLGMAQTHYVDPTGLSQGNRASPLDIALLAETASHVEEMRRLTTSRESEVDVHGRRTVFRSSNEFVRSGVWDIVLQKTGYIKEAGRCMVMEVQIAGRKMVMVVLDSLTPNARRNDVRKLHEFARERATQLQAIGKTNAQGPLTPVTSVTPLSTALPNGQTSHPGLQPL